MPVVFEDHSKEVLQELERRTRASLEACGGQAVAYAKNTVTAAGRVRTDTLRGEITHQVQGNSVDVGTNTSYAIYHEMGTGIYIAGGRKTPWPFFDEKGEMHWTRGVPPLHMIKNSVANHINTFKSIITKIMKA